MVTHQDIVEKKWYKMTGPQHRIDKNGCGTCAMCNKYDKVAYRTVDACNNCGQKMGEGVMAFFNVRQRGFCHFCSEYVRVEFNKNIATVNILLCMSCKERVKAAAKLFEKEGPKNLNPFWKALRKEHGNEWADICGFNEHIPQLLDADKIAENYWKKRRYLEGR